MRRETPIRPRITSFSTLLGFPYLYAFMIETNRLTLGATNRLLRYSLTETLTRTAACGPNEGNTWYFLAP